MFVGAILCDLYFAYHSRLHGIAFTTLCIAMQFFIVALANSFDCSLNSGPASGTEYDDENRHHRINLYRIRHRMVYNLDRKQS